MRDPTCPACGATSTCEHTELNRAHTHALQRRRDTRSATVPKSVLRWLGRGDRGLAVHVDTGPPGEVWTVNLVDAREGERYAARTEGQPGESLCVVFRRTADRLNSGLLDWESVA